MLPTLPPPLFKCEHSLLQMMLDGKKTFDLRIYDMRDQRIARLHQGRYIKSYQGYKTHDAWQPIEPYVDFLDKATGEVVRFVFRGMKFTPLAPGWCFLLLGPRVTIKE